MKIKIPIHEKIQRNSYHSQNLYHLKVSWGKKNIQYTFDNYFNRNYFSFFMICTVPVDIFYHS